MIKAKDAIAIARSLLNTPYGKEEGQLDCINLLKKIIRTAPGGVKNYNTAGTNSLWDSIDMSSKYRDLIWRQEGLDGAKPGMIAFKRYGVDREDHVGLVTGEGTVIHASSEYDRTVETSLTVREGWDLLGIHRYIEVDDEIKEEESMQTYQARVVLKDGNKPGNYLMVRVGPGGSKVGEIEHGAIVTVNGHVRFGNDDWAFVSCEGGVPGYVHACYLERIELLDSEDEIDTSDEVQGGRMCFVITDESGQTFFPTGKITMEMRMVFD